MAAITKLNQPPQYWDRLFAPSSCLAMISTVDAQGRRYARDANGNPAWFHSR